MDVKKHFERPKHIQCIKDVFGSIPLIASTNPSSSLSKNTNNVTCPATSSTNDNTTRTSFIVVQNDQRSLTHEESKL